MFDEHKEIYLFFADLRPNSITTLQVTWIRKISQVPKINNLHNLSYVTLFFVISFTDGIFDAFNCWNHCIF